MEKPGSGLLAASTVMAGLVSTAWLNEGVPAISCTAPVMRTRVAHGHRGVGLHHKQGVGSGGVAVGAGRVVLHVEAGRAQAGVHGRHHALDGVGARRGQRPSALNGANGRDRLRLCRGVRQGQHRKVEIMPL